MKKIKTIPQEELIALDESFTQSSQTTYSLKDCVTNFVNNSVVNTALEVSSLHEIWEYIVGSDVGKHVRIKHIKDETLHLVADHPAWSTQIKYLKSEIIEKINTALNEQKIASISLTISPQNN